MQKTHKLRTCYLDMDGVLVDFIGGVFAAYGIDNDKQNEVKDWDFFSQFQIDELKFWETIASESDWWANLEPYSDFKQVFDLCQAYSERVVLCTSGGCPAAASGKNKWAKTYLGLDSKDIIHTTEKWRLAYMPGTILVDDADSNIAMWHSACIDAGRMPHDWAIRYPRPWNRSRIFSCDTTRIPYLRLNLKVCSDRFQNKEN